MNGEFVRELRSRLEMTRAELGLIVGVDRMTILRWENQQSRLSPTVRRIMRAIDEQPSTIPLFTKMGTEERARKAEEALRW